MPGAACARHAAARRLRRRQPRAAARWPTATRCTCSCGRAPTPGGSTSIRERRRLHARRPRRPRRRSSALVAARPSPTGSSTSPPTAPTPGRPTRDRIVATNVARHREPRARRALRPGVEAFVNAGSSSEYGFKDHAPREARAGWSRTATTPSPRRPRRSSATLARAASGACTTLRLYSVYGPWEEPARLMPALLLRGLDGRLPPLANRGRRATSSTSTTSARRSWPRRTRPAPARSTTSGAGVQTTLADAGRGGARADPRPARAGLGRLAGARLGHGDSGWRTRARIEADLGWRARTDLRSGLAATLEWLRDAAPRERYRL